MQLEVDVKCMQANFGGGGLFGFGNFVPFLIAFKTDNRTYGTPCVHAYYSVLYYFR